MKNIAIEYLYGFDEVDAYDMPRRGYRNDVLVICPDAKKYRLSFYDPVRLSQDIKTEKIIMEQNLIVIEELTQEEIEKSAQTMWELGFFNKLKEYDN